MKNQVARVYARALLDVLNQRGSSLTLTQAKDELTQWTKLISGSKELTIALYGPVSSGGEKARIIHSLSPKLNSDRAVVLFLNLLAKKGRFSLLPEICDSLDEVKLASQGGTLGIVESAESISQEDLDSLAQAFKKKLNRPVELRMKTNPNLLAGLKVTVNGVTYDGTLRSQLNRVREMFSHGVGSNSK